MLVIWIKSCCEWGVLLLHLPKLKWPLTPESEGFLQNWSFHSLDFLIVATFWLPLPRTAELELLTPLCYKERITRSLKKLVHLIHLSSPSSLSSFFSFSSILLLYLVLGFWSFSDVASWAYDHQHFNHFSCNCCKVAIT